MDEKELKDEIQYNVREKLFPLLERYLFDTRELEAVLKWKPIVLIIGNYSSGKSTLVNELLGKEVQRTGQAPTDDSFTIITAPEPEETENDIPGSTLINDERFPFTSFKAYGERFISHVQMKLLDEPFLDNLAIIDSPGMLDSVTEKGRGYDFPEVIGDFAKLADLVVLMFDPHKAGTIKETYTTIRNTLPETASEDRIVFVMSRIDECDNLADLVRSYGTLCWNLSQMTGRKDIPRIYLTFSTTVVRNIGYLDDWVDERTKLKEKIMEAPELRINNILFDVDKKVNELKMTVEAMTSFHRGGQRLLKRAVRTAFFCGLPACLFLDFISQYTMDFPRQTLIFSLLTKTFSINNLIVPAVGIAVTSILIGLWYRKWTLPRYIKKCRANVDKLVSLNDAYREQVWSRVRKNVLALLSKPGFEEMSFEHQRNLYDIEGFIKDDLQMYYSLK
jgi:GTPase SAR1 family protein